MTAHAIVDPCYGDGLAHVAPAYDEVDGSVPGAGRDARLRCKQNTVPRRRDKDAEDAETVAVAGTVGAPRRGQADDAGGDVDGYAHVLCFEALPAEFRENGRREEGGGIASVDDAEVHERSAVYFPIAEDAFGRRAIETIHLSVGNVGREARDEELFLLKAEE